MDRNQLMRALDSLVPNAAWHPADDLVTLTYAGIVWQDARPLPTLATFDGVTTKRYVYLESFTYGALPSTPSPSSSTASSAGLRLSVKL